ncbi:MAG: hypothetical protein H7039_16830 [Bryobacteraceae bacterium]|nr:hypothetical protein [Bryobacteraceae bacterium]
MLIVASLFFVIGAAPLIVYNAKHSMVTFGSNTRLDTGAVEGKAQVLKSTFNGDALFGSMMREPWDGPVKDPMGPLEVAIAKVSELGGERRKGLALSMFLACLVVLPFARNFPGGGFGIFALIAGSVGYLQMLFTLNAGGAAHHTILLWPLPYIVIGVALAYLWARNGSRLSRALLTSLVVLCCAANLLVLTTYYTYLIRNGGTDSWTEAMYPALATIRSMDKAAIGVVDWGFFDTVRLSEQGQSPIFPVEDPATGSEANVLQQIQTKNAVFLSHSEGHESFPGITARLVAFAGQHGYMRTDVQKFFDYNGRYTVQTFRFRKGLELSAPASRLTASQ